MKNSIIFMFLFLSLFLVATVSASLNAPDLSLCNNVSEDTSASCTITSPNLSISSPNNLICSLTNTSGISYTLSYIGVANFNGIASCLVSATDGNETNSSTLSINITSVNDVPVINSYSPSSFSVLMVPGKSQIFTINATDVDSTVTINWYIDSVFVQTGERLNFTKPTGSYSLVAKATDGFANVSNSWSVNVGSNSDYNCGEIGGFYPSGDKLCPADIFNSKDTNKCCSVPYIPAFRDASGCEFTNKSVQISFTEPASSAIFELGEQIDAEYKIVNTYSEDQDFDTGLYIYDLTTDTYEAYRSTDVQVKPGQTVTTSLSIKVPENLDLLDDFVLMLKAEDDICNMNYIPLSLRRPRHVVKITSFFIPDEAYCGETISAEVKIENSGSNDENTYINLKNQNLSLDKSTDKFTLEKYSGSNKAQKTLSFTIPEDATNGTYPLRLSVYYSDENRMEFMSKNIEVTNCRKASSTISSSVNTAQNQTSNSTAPENSDVKRILLLAAVSLIIIIVILFVLYRIKIIKARETEEILEKPVKKTRIKLER